MRNDWDSIDENTKKRLNEALDNIPIWYADGQLDEVKFCESFLQKIPLKCINGIFFGLDGMMPDALV